MLLNEILLLTPPFTQLNTPYPATAYLKGFLNTKGISSFQIDLGLEVTLSLFSKEVLIEMFDFAIEHQTYESDSSIRLLSLRDRYEEVIEDVVHFLQGKNPSLVRQLCTDNFLPRGNRFQQLETIEYAFGTMGFMDMGKHLATLFLEDLSDFIVECIDPHFGFSRYAERLGRCANQFDSLYEALNEPYTLVDRITIACLEKHLQEQMPKLVLISVPFPGNLFSGFRCGQYIKQHYPDVTVAMGGGFPNTELRSLSDTRVFEFVDYITLDDGELPVELLYKNLNRPKNASLWKRTFMIEEEKVVYKDTALQCDYKMSEVGTPDYSDLLLNQYISMIEIVNPMHSLWSDGRWNKLTMAHGCYWGKCTFCDVSLDYIKVYEPVHAKLLVDRMEEIIAQTGETGFHFVDEAAPPKLMGALALEILRRKLIVTWWTNIRFEKRFTADLCRLLKASGCIAVSGGLEVASNRLLELIKKGVTVEQVARVTKHFTDAQIMVHAYLMYGYPTQTEQETVDSLEMVRQLFEAGVIDSGFWHQFALTAHSPIGLDPAAFGVIPDRKEIGFADNDVAFKDTTGIDHSKFSFGLKKSLYNYMHDMGFEAPLQSWFDFEVPATTIPASFIQNCIDTEPFPAYRAHQRVIYLGNLAMAEPFEALIKGKQKSFQRLHFHTLVDSITVDFESAIADWFMDILELLKPTVEKPMTYQALKASFLEQFEDFELWWYSDNVEALRETGLIIV